MCSGGDTIKRSLGACPGSYLTVAALPSPGTLLIIMSVRGILVK